MSDEVYRITNPLADMKDVNVSAIHVQVYGQDGEEHMRKIFSGDLPTVGSVYVLVCTEVSTDNGGMKAILQFRSLAGLDIVVSDRTTGHII